MYSGVVVIGFRWPTAEERPAVPAMPAMNSSSNKFTFSTCERCAPYPDVLQSYSDRDYRDNYSCIYTHEYHTFLL